jgi:methylglyoxal synthase
VPPPRSAARSHRRKRLALIAHDEKKAALADWVAAHRAALKPHRLICTGTTGSVLRARCPDLEIARVKSGPLGGDQQIGAAIASGRIDALIFFIDPLEPMPHDVDVKALTRLAVVYDIPMALSPASAELLVAGGFLVHR